MKVELKVGSVVHLECPEAVQVRSLDPAIATAKIDGGTLTVTAVKAGTTWLKTELGDMFGGLLPLTVTGETAAKK